MRTGRCSPRCRSDPERQDWRHGKPALRQGCGLSNIQSGAKVTPDTVFRIGSVTKQFTAVAMLQLVRDGKVKLDDSITKYVPDLDTRGQTTIIKAQVPMAEMLTYEQHLTSATGGRGSYHMEYSHYDEVPSQLQSKIIAAAKAERAGVQVEEV